MGKVIMSGIVPTLTVPVVGNMLSMVAEGSTVTIKDSSYRVVSQNGNTTTLVSDESGEEITVDGTATLNDDGSISV